MSSVTVKAGAVEPLTIPVRKASDGTPLTGSTSLRVSIRRTSDNQQLDFADGTFKPSGWTTRRATLTEVDATNAPGWYEYVTGGGVHGIDTTGWSSVAHDLTFEEVTTTLAAGAPQIGYGEIRVGGSIENLDGRVPAALDGGNMASKVNAVANDAITAAALATDAITNAKIAAGAITSSEAPALANLDVASSTLATAASLATVSSAVAALPSANAIATQVWSTALPGAFSSGQAGFLAGTYLDAAVSSRLPTSTYAAAPSAAAVATQVLGTAVPGAFGAGTLGFVLGTNLDVLVSTRLAASSYTAAPTAAANAAAVWATAEGTPTSGTFGYGLQLLRMGLTNRLEETAGSPGLLKLYADDGTTLLKTWQLRDGSGGAVTASSGAPARRGAAT